MEGGAQVCVVAGKRKAVLYSRLYVLMTRYPQ
jgi:hypothetical protein